MISEREREDQLFHYTNHVIKALGVEIMKNSKKHLGIFFCSGYKKIMKSTPLDRKF